MTKRMPTTVLYALDFDGVLVDSAMETGRSGYAAAKILFEDAPWLDQLSKNEEELDHILNKFCLVRPCLESGWEAALLIKLLADDGLETDTILANFQPTLRKEQMEKLHLDKETCNSALKRARNEWIERSVDDWIGAHGFFEGACSAVRGLLETAEQSRNVYIITTKAADYSKRLLEKQRLFGKDAPGGGIPEENIFGLGSGPKEEVLAKLLDKQGSGDGGSAIAVFVEDRLLTLDHAMADTSPIKNRVVPVFASWGYNTLAQREAALNSNYVVLSKSDSSSISQVLDDQKAKFLLDERNSKN